MWRWSCALLQVLDKRDGHLEIAWWSKRGAFDHPGAHMLTDHLVKVSQCEDEQITEAHLLRARRTQERPTQERSVKVWAEQVT